MMQNEYEWQQGKGFVPGVVRVRSDDPQPGAPTEVAGLLGVSSGLVEVVRFDRYAPGGVVVERISFPLYRVLWIQWYPFIQRPGGGTALHPAFSAALKRDLRPSACAFPTEHRASYYYSHHYSPDSPESRSPYCPAPPGEAFAVSPAPPSPHLESEEPPYGARWWEFPVATATPVSGRRRDGKLVTHGWCHESVYQANGDASRFIFRKRGLLSMDLLVWRGLQVGAAGSRPKWIEFVDRIRGVCYRVLFTDAETQGTEYAEGLFDRWGVPLSCATVYDRRGCRRAIDASGNLVSR